MNEWSKKFLDRLCENVKAMQAEIELIKNREATHSSGSNIQACSQNSNLVSGSGPQGKKLFLKGPVKTTR